MEVVGEEGAEGTRFEREGEGLNDGSLGGVRYFEIPGGDAWEEKEAGGARKRKVSGSVGGGGGGDGIKRVRNHSPPGEEGGAGGGTRGLFLRPNAVVSLYLLCEILVSEFEYFLSIIPEIHGRRLGG